MENPKTEIKNTLDVFQQNCEQFMALLKSEKNSILSRDADALLKISNHKKELIKKISQSDIKLNSITKEIQFKQGESLNDYIENQGDELLNNQWNSVTDSVQACMVANKQNESLLACSINHVSQALNMLITNATGEPCSTYSKHGHKTNINHDIVLVKA